MDYGRFLFIASVLLFFFIKRFNLIRGVLKHLNELLYETTLIFLKGKKQHQDNKEHGGENNDKKNR